MLSESGVEKLVGVLFWVNKKLLLLRQNKQSLGALLNNLVQQHQMITHHVQRDNSKESGSNRHLQKWLLFARVVNFTTELQNMSRRSMNSMVNDRECIATAHCLGRYQMVVPPRVAPVSLDTLFTHLAHNYLTQHVSFYSIAQEDIDTKNQIMTNILEENVLLLEDKHTLQHKQNSICQSNLKAMTALEDKNQELERDNEKLCILLNVPILRLS